MTKVICLGDLLLWERNESLVKVKAVMFNQ